MPEEPQAGGSASLPPPHPAYGPDSAWGQAHPRWGWPSVPTEHTAAFPEASLGHGPLHLEAGKEPSSFPPLSLDNKGVYGSQEYPGGNP